MSWFEIPDSDGLSEEQKKIYSFQLNANLLINGAAGSGKTLLALYRAKQLEDNGQNVLFIVYTNTLREYVELGADEIGLTKTRIVTIQDLSEESIGYRLRDFSLFDKQSCRLISKYFSNFDHVIIDEGQDFSIDIYRDLFCNLGKYFTLCIDSKQQIYSRHNFLKNSVKALFDSITERKLDFTYRNPEKILKLAINYYRDQLNTTPAETGIKSYNSHEGIVKLITTNDEIATLRRIIQEKDLNTIGILLPRRKVVISVANYLENYGDVQFEKYHSDGGSLSFANEDAKILPYWSSKGTQFDIVVIPFISKATILDCDNIFDANWDDERKALYVAMTRAKQKLIFIETEKSYFPYKDSLDEEYYENSQIDEQNFKELDVGKFIINGDIF